MLSFPVLLAVAGITSVATAGIFFVGGTFEEPLHDTVEVSVASESGTNPTMGSNSDPVAPVETTTPVSAGDTPEVSADDAEVARTLKLLLGSWTRESYGTRTLTINADGTAKMVIKPSSVYAFYFGSVINVDVKWELQDGHVDYKVTGGTPTDKVDLVKKRWGDHWHEKIDKLDEKTLILQGEEGDKYEWTRVEEHDPSADAT
jgi:hypothetical protein